MKCCVNVALISQWIDKCSTLSEGISCIFNWYNYLKIHATKYIYRQYINTFECILLYKVSEMETIYVTLLVIRLTE